MHNMISSSLTICPVCNETAPANAQECPNCGTVLSSTFTFEQHSKEPLRVKKARHPWLAATKHAGQIAAERNLKRKLKTVGASLDSGDFDGTHKLYRSVRKYASQVKNSELISIMLDLLEVSASKLVGQKEVLASASKHVFAPKRPQFSLIGKIGLFPVLILAGIGLVGIFNNNILGSIEQTNIIPTSTVQKIDSPMPGQAIESTPTESIILTASSTAIPNLAPISVDNLKEVRELFHWSAGEESVVSLSFFPDGNFIASGTASGVTKIWDVWDGKVVLEFDGTYAAFSPDGNRIAIAGKTGIFLYDLSSGELLYALDTKSPYYGVAFSPDSQLIAGGTEYGKLYIWSVNNGALQQAAGGLGGNVNRLAFSRDGIFLAAASSSKTYIWNLQDKKIGRDIDFKRNKPVFLSTALDADGEWYAAGSENGQIYVWRVINGESMPDLYDESPFVTGLQFLHGSNNPEILVSGDEVHLSFWALQEYKFDNRSIYVSAPIQSLAVSPDNRLVVTGGNDGVIHVWGVLP